MNRKKRFNKTKLRAPQCLGDVPELTEAKAKLDGAINAAVAAHKALADFTDEALREAKAADESAFLEAAQRGEADPGREQERRYHAGHEAAKARAVEAVEAAEQARRDFDQLVLDNADDLAASTDKLAKTLRAKAARDAGKAADSLAAYERAARIAAVVKNSQEAGAVRGAPSVEFGSAGPFEPPPVTARPVFESVAKRLEREPGKPQSPPQLRPTPKNPAKSRNLFAYEVEGDQ
jgi:hypothetical protein